MRALGALQQVLPAPTMIPQGHYIIIFDFKDDIFPIPLYPDNKECVSHSVSKQSTANDPISVESFTTGMKNSPTVCQYCAHKALNLVLIKFPKVLVIQYMNDALHSCSFNQYLNESLTLVLHKLSKI